MSISEANRFARTQRAPQELEVAYPAEFHFRIIVEAEVAAEAALGALLATYQITAPLTASKVSSAGRYQAFSVSVKIRSQAELHSFDAAVKQVPGVRMLL